MEDKLIEVLWAEDCVYSGGKYHIVSSNKQVFCGADIKNFKRKKALYVIDLNSFCTACISELCQQEGIEID